jgi:hypothetical protein
VHDKRENGYDDGDLTVVGKGKKEGDGGRYKWKEKQS